jgi:hypothetical protein
VRQCTRRWLLLLPITLLVRPTAAEKPRRNERPLTPKDIKGSITECHEWAKDSFISDYHIWRDHICRDCGRTEQVLEIAFQDKLFIARWEDYLETRKNRERTLPFSHVCEDLFGILK